MSLKINEIQTGFRYAKYGRMLKDKQDYTILQHNDAEHMTKNVNLGFCNRVIFKILDKINPFMIKHPESGQKIFNIGEKIIKLSEKISGEIK